MPILFEFCLFDGQYGFSPLPIISQDGNASRSPSSRGWIMTNRILVVAAQVDLRHRLIGSLSASGYESAGAANGKEALAALQTHTPQLMVLDATLPATDGWSLLSSLRASTRFRSLPVILLSDSADRESVLKAARLGVRGYLVKSRFSFPELDARVALCLGRGGDANVAAKAPASPGEAAAIAVKSPAGHSPASVTLPPSPVRAAARIDDLPELLNKERCLRRAETSLAGRTLSGAVAQVLALAGSPNADLPQLAALIGRDPMLSARVLQAANSPAYASKRGVVATLPDAVRNIGCAAVRNIAASVGIFDAMPATGADGFNPILCWQHSFAVARLSELLMTLRDPTQAGIAYLAGLCHDLGEILFRTQFGPEHHQIVEAEQRTGLPRAEIERRMLGITHGQLIRTIMECIGLPETIRRPVEALHAPRRGLPDDAIAKVLTVAESYANGLLLSSSPDARVAPLLKSTCQTVTASPDPATPEAEIFRGEILCLTAMLARLGASEEAKLLKPQFERSNLRAWVAREPCFSSFDPVAAALDSLAAIEVHDRLPGANESVGCGKLIVVSRGDSLTGLTQPDIQRCLTARAATLGSALWLTEQPGNAAAVRRLAYPVAVSELARFLEIPDARAAA
jgi:HD-like signal output (HDOD) protein/CheY-like chemotaxis protein